MKKVIVMLAILLVPSFLTAKVPSNKWRIEPTVVNSVAYGTTGALAFSEFGFNAKFGFGKGEGFFGYSRLAVPSGTVGIDFGLGAGYDLPLWYFSVGRMRKNLAIGFTFDAGFSLGYAGAFYFDMLGIGFGGRMTYDITRNMGLVVEPLHVGIHFLGYSGVFGGYFGTDLATRVGFYYSI